MFNLIKRLFGARRAGNTYHVFLRGGHRVVLTNVTSATIHKNPTTGDYSGYNFVFAPGCQPNLCSFSIPDIVGVVSLDVD